MIQAALLGVHVAPVLGQHDHSTTGASSLRLGVQAVGVITHANPGLRGANLTEGYLTQPVAAIHASMAGLQFGGMLNLEGLTLKRGELNAGAWGEGYMDRRHPHTYLHEAVVSYQPPRLLGLTLSVAAGRGFAAFGSDDPMTRPLVKYPVNHHLAQILERYVAIGAVRRGPVILEGSVFNGDEPLSPRDLGDLDRFGDSWSARATIRPVSWLELQASRAFVESPEQPAGGGLDHKAWHASARVQRYFGNEVELYGLLEGGRTVELSGNTEVFRLHTVLAEAAVRSGGWQAVARFERSDRPEEERLINLFRSVRPATDNSVLGTTRWTAGTFQLSRHIALGSVRVQPLVEVSRLHARPNERPAILDPVNLYGSANLWSLSVGIRSAFGLQHTRMGRYGAAQADHNIH